MDKINLYKMVLLIIIFSFFLSCVKENERLTPLNKTKQFYQELPCWIIYPPEQCPEFKGYTNFDFFISSLELSDKCYNSTVENDLKIKFVSELFNTIACKIESEFVDFKSCKYENGAITCKSKTKKNFCISTEGKIGLGHFHIVKSYWKRKNGKNWELFALGKISKKYTNINMFLTN